MKVLKFGGTSVANAQNISLVIDIVTEASKSEPLVAVVSAFSGVTDLLLLASEKAAAKDKIYIEIVSQIDQKHKETIYKLVAVIDQSELLETINSNLNHLKTLLDGCFLLGELSNRTSDTIVSYGELLSSQIIAKALGQKIAKVNFKDSRLFVLINNLLSDRRAHV